MDEVIPNLPWLLDLAWKYRQQGVESTGAEVVNFAGDLYNVEGSTTDPKKVPGHDGVNWKQLLIDMAGLAGSSCYVTNSSGGVHPDFSVGGHMTVNRTGEVAVGGQCHLMPLCSWHNNPARDGVKFAHDQTKMLSLTGYMQGELAATFRLRLPSDAPYAVLYLADGGWNCRDLSEGERRNLSAVLPAVADARQETAFHVLFERVRAADQTLHFVRAVHLPGLEVADLGDRHP